MKNVLLSILGLTLSVSANAGTVCSGAVTVDAFAPTDYDVAKIEFVAEDKALYTGPHSSMKADENVILKIDRKSTKWQLTDLSSTGHGGVKNTFEVKWVESARGQGFVHLVYEDSIGYKVKGLLSCQN